MAFGQGDATPPCDEMKIPENPKQVEVHTLLYNTSTKVARERHTYVEVGTLRYRHDLSALWLVNVARELMSTTAGG
jgi:hypothetical protein